MIITPIILPNTGSSTTGWASIPGDGSGAGGAGGSWYDNDHCNQPARGGHGCAQICIIKFNSSTKSNIVKVQDSSTKSNRDITLFSKDISNNLKYDGTKLHISTNTFTPVTNLTNNTIAVPIKKGDQLKIGGNYKLVSSATNLNSKLKVSNSKLATKDKDKNTSYINFITQAENDNNSYKIPYTIENINYIASDSGDAGGSIFVQDAIVVISLQAGGGGGGGADSTRGLFNWGSGGGGGGGGGACAYVLNLRNLSYYLHINAGKGGAAGKNSGDGSTGGNGNSSFVYISTSSDPGYSPGRVTTISVSGGKGGGGGYDDGGNQGSNKDNYGGAGGQCTVTGQGWFLTKLCIVDGGKGGRGSNGNNGGSKGGTPVATGDFSTSFSEGDYMFKINISADNDWAETKGGSVNGHQDSGGGGGATWYGNGGYSSRYTAPSSSGGMNVSMLL